MLFFIVGLSTVGCTEAATSDGARSGSQLPTATQTSNPLSTTPVMARGAASPSTRPEATTSARPQSVVAQRPAGTASPTPTTSVASNVQIMAPGTVAPSTAAPPTDSGLAAQAHGRWPPACVAPNYFLYAEFTSPLHQRRGAVLRETERGVQVALQWSPDGSEVLFASGAKVYAAAADGSRLERLIDASGPSYLGKSRYAPQALTAVAVTANGERVAYAVCLEYALDWKNPEDPEVARCVRVRRSGIVNEDDGRGCSELPKVTRDYVAGPLRLTPGSSFEEIRLWDRTSQTTIPLAGGYAPAWSPDGTRLAFLSWSYPGPGLFVVTADGGELQLRARGNFTRPPRWSPDGRQLAVVEGPARNATLYVLEPDGTGRQRLSETRSDPAWSPDGSRIAFVRAESAEFALYTIAPDGTDERRITAYRNSPDWWDQSVAWSPDGSMLLYGCGGICVVTLDGQPVGERTLASRKGYSAAWSPDGTRIAILTLDGRWSDDPVLVTTAPDGAAPQILVAHDDQLGLLGVGVHGDTQPADVSGCTSGTAVASPAANPGLVGDCEVLLRARPVFAGSVPAALNWSPERPIGEWGGVVVDGTPPRVVELTFPASRANGRIPPEIHGLSQLRELDLRGLYLGGELPPELGELKNLRALRLSHSYIHGPIPPELGQLAQLEELSLWDTYFSGSIPPELAGLRRLRSLGFAFSPFLVGSIPPELGRLASLERLNLRGNGLTGSIPVELGQLTNLRTLVLKSNQLTGPIPSELDALTRLERLELGGNQLTGCVPPGLRDRLGLADCR